MYAASGERECVMQRKYKRLAAVAGAVLVGSGALAVNQASAAPSNGSLQGDGSLRLCVGEGKAYVVADGPDEDLIRTPVLGAGACANYTDLTAGTYYIKADKYLDAPCWTGSPRKNGALNPSGGRCHGKVHHAHTSRYEGPPRATAPAGAPFTTIDVPDYIIVNVLPRATTFVSLHVTDEEYPECLTSPADRTCDAHPVTGPNVGT